MNPSHHSPGGDWAWHRCRCKDRWRRQHWNRRRRRTWRGDRADAPTAAYANNRAGKVKFRVVPDPGLAPHYPGPRYGRDRAENCPDGKRCNEICHIAQSIILGGNPQRGEASAGLITAWLKCQQMSLAMHPLVLAPIPVLGAGCVSGFGHPSTWPGGAG